MTKRTDLATLGTMLLILLLAAVIRIHNIDGPALWTDEGFVYYTFKVNLFEALAGDRHPPFYFYTLHAWESLAGDSILALRWWSMLPSMLSLAMMYQLGREIRRYLPELPAGWLGLPVLAALVMSQMDAENYMAQELRMYTWHVLFAVFSTWAYLRFIRRHNTFTGFLWLIANLLLIYTHYFGAFILLAQGIHALFFLRGDTRWKAFGVLTISGLVFLPWAVLVTRDQFAEEAVSLTTERIDLQALVLDLREKWLGQQWPLLLIMMFAGLVTLARRDWQTFINPSPTPPQSIREGLSPSQFRGGISLFLIALLLLPIALTIIMGHDELVLLARRLVQITVPITLLIAIGIALLSTQARAIIAVAVILYGVTTVDWYRVKVPWHTITQLSAEYAQPDELALADVAFEESALLYYYDHLLPEGMQISTYPVWSDMERFDYYEILLPELLAEQSTLQTGVETAWVTFFSPDDGILHKLEDAGFFRTMTRIYDHVGSEIDVYRYDRLPEDAESIPFENGMVLNAREVMRSGLRTDLWWSVTETPDVDYTVSVALLTNDGQIVAQYDAQPQNNSRPTSTIQSGEIVYDPHVLQLVDGIDNLPPGDYSVIVRVYEWTPDVLLPVLTTEGNESVTIGIIALPPVPAK